MSDQEDSDNDLSDNSAPSTTEDSDVSVSDEERGAEEDPHQRLIDAQEQELERARRSVTKAELPTGPSSTTLHIILVVGVILLGVAVTLVELANTEGGLKKAEFWTGAGLFIASILLVWIGTFLYLQGVVRLVNQHLQSVSTYVGGIETPVDANYLGKSYLESAATYYPMFVAMSYVVLGAGMLFVFHDSMWSRTLGYIIMVFAAITLGVFVMRSMHATLGLVRLGSTEGAAFMHMHARKKYRRLSRRIRRGVEGRMVADPKKRISAFRPAKWSA